MERENRYLVIKYKDANKYLNQDEVEQLAKLNTRITAGRWADGKVSVNCVVVEQDWPEYEKVWEMIESRVGNWISVDEKLPEDARPVIIDGGCGHYSHKYKGWFTNMERDNFGEYRPIQWEVKYWMPIPKTPEKS